MAGITSYNPFFNVLRQWLTSSQNGSATPLQGPSLSQNRPFDPTQFALAFMPLFNKIAAQPNSPGLITGLPVYRPTNHNSFNTTESPLAVGSNSLLNTGRFQVTADNLGGVEGVQTLTMTTAPGSRSQSSLVFNKEGQLMTNEGAVNLFERITPTQTTAEFTFGWNQQPVTVRGEVGYMGGRGLGARPFISQYVFEFGDGTTITVDPHLGVNAIGIDQPQTTPALMLGDVIRPQTPPLLVLGDVIAPPRLNTMILGKIAPPPRPPEMILGDVAPPQNG